jgi:hypothetical protein
MHCQLAKSAATWLTSQLRATHTTSWVLSPQRSQYMMTCSLCIHELQAPSGAQPPALDAAAAKAAAAASRQAAYEAAQVDASPIQARLAQELFDKGFSDFRWVCKL